MTLAWGLLQRPLEPNGYTQLDACTDHLDLRELAMMIAIATGTHAEEPLILNPNYHDAYQGDSSRFLKLLRERQIQPLPMEQQIRLTHMGLQSPL
jgi:hypothetical protein